jgi:regulatory protein
MDAIEPQQEDEGDNAGNDRIAAAKKTADVAKLRSKAIKLLAGREHSEKELLQKLARASARQAQLAKMSKSRAQHREKVNAKRANQTSLENGFDEGDPLFPDASSSSSKSGETAPQVLADLAANQPEEMSERERRIPAAQNAAAVLESLKADGFQSDQRYAESITRHFAGRMSKSAIAGKLKAAGIDRDAIEDTMASALGEEHTDDFTTAQALWQNKFREPPANEKEKAKHVRFLQSRGFSISIALRILREAGARADDGDES